MKRRGLTTTKTKELEVEYLEELRDDQFIYADVLIDNYKELNVVLDNNIEKTRKKILNKFPDAKKAVIKWDKKFVYQKIIYNDNKKNI